MLSQKKYQPIWLAFEALYLKSDSLKPNDKSSQDFNASFQENDEKTMISSTKDPFSLKRNKTLSEKREFLTIKLNENTDFASNSEKNSNFMSFYLQILEKNIKEISLRKLLQKLEKEQKTHFFSEFLDKRLYSHFLDTNPVFLDKALKTQKKELKFALSSKTGLFMQKTLVFNKISANSASENHEEIEMALSPAKRCSFLKKTSGIDFWRFPDVSPSENAEISEDSLTENAENRDEFAEKDEDFVMLETEIDVEETEDFVYIYNEFEGNPKIYKETLRKLKKILQITENIENFYPVTYLKKFGFLSAILVISKRNLYILKNCGFDEKTGFFELSEIPVSSSQEKDKGLLISKGSNIQPVAISLRKTTFFDDIIAENPLDLSKSGFLQSDLEIKASNSRFCRFTRLPIEKIVEISSKRYFLSHCSLAIHTVKKEYFLIVGKEKRARIYDEIKRLFPSKLIKTQVSTKENLFFTMNYRKNPFFFEENAGNSMSFQTFDSPSLVKLAVSLWQEGLLGNFEYLMFLNIVSGRTYSDLSQYPVFPWVLRDFSSDFGEINLNNSDFYRDLSKPIGALTEKRARFTKEFYEENSEKFHYGSHYSNPGIVSYFLLRLMPFGQLAMELQGGKFDFSDRLFGGIKESWDLVEQADYKELVPEFFFLPDFLMNLNKFEFGETSFGNKVFSIFFDFF